MSAAVGSALVKLHCCRATTKLWKCAIRGRRTLTNLLSFTSSLAIWQSCARWWRLVSWWWYLVYVGNIILMQSGNYSWDQEGHEWPVPGSTLFGRCQWAGPHLEELWTEWVHCSSLHLFTSLLCSVITLYEHGLYELLCLAVVFSARQAKDNSQ